MMLIFPPLALWRALCLGTSHFCLTVHFRLENRCPGCLSGHPPVHRKHASGLLDGHGAGPWPSILGWYVCGCVQEVVCLYVNVCGCVCVCVHSCACRCLLSQLSCRPV